MDSIQHISTIQLALSLVPVGFVLLILFKWSMDVRSSLYATFRMLIQLVLIGYFLAFIFDAKNAWIILLVLVIMIGAASWISLKSLEIKSAQLFWRALSALSIGGGIVLLLVTQGVLDLSPWYLPQYFVPLAGMIFANAMNSVSLAAERFYAELDRGQSYLEARNFAMHAALIPMTNSLFAVGLVAIPGMMTGQILSGVSPFIAARYQIMVMCMIFGSGGLSAGLFLLFCRNVVPTNAESVTKK